MATDMLKILYVIIIQNEFLAKCLMQVLPKSDSLKSTPLNSRLNLFVQVGRLVALVIARKTFTITNLPMNLMRIEGILLAVSIIVQLDQYLPMIRPYTTMGYIPSFHAIPTKTLSLRNFKSAKW